MPPLLTNQLLERLIGALEAVTAATTQASEVGIAMSPNTPFFRMGEPVRIPVTPTSGNIAFTDFVLPPNVTTFQVTNNNPFSVRLRGTRQGQSFRPVDATVGWCWPPGYVGVHGTLYPVAMAAMSVDGPMGAFDPAQKAGDGFIELQYGTGG